MIGEQVKETKQKHMFRDPVFPTCFTKVDKTFVFN